MTKTFRKANLINYFLYTYIFLQFIFYILLHTTDIFEYDVGCYSVIVMGFILSLLVALHYKKKIYLLVTVAQFFTLIADTFLVLIDDYYILSVISFCFAQIFYYIYILYTTNRYNHFHKILFKTRIIITSILLLVYIIDIIIKLDFGFLSYISLIYFSLLLHNLIESFFSIKHNRFLTIGLLLFMLCDICVGFYNLVDMFNISENSIIYIIAYGNIDWVWIFYHPSQVILSLVVFLDMKKAYFFK